MDSHDYEFEQEFYAEVRDKKRTAQGARHRASRGSVKGGVRYVYEMMDRKARKEYTKNGEVRRSNMYKEYSGTWEEFKRLPKEQKVAIIAEKLKTMTCSEIAESMETHTSNVMNFRYLYLNKGNESRKEKTIKPSTEEVNAMQMYTISARQAERDPMFNITFLGSMTGEEINNRLTAILMALSKNNSYKIHFSVEEIDTKEMPPESPK